ncbi:MAG: PASTA domain-containing protein, partial [Mycobacteriales bacterium]
PSGAPVAGRPTRRRRTGLVLTAVVTALALLALGGGYYLGSYRYTSAPSVLTLTLAKATQKIEHAGLKAKHGTDEFSEDVARGLVLRQTPKPNGRIRKGGTVTVVLSKGPDRRTVPSLTGRSLDDARAALRAVGLTVAPNPTSEYSDTVAKDLVLRSDPGPGQRLKPGTAVRLVLSKGKQPVAVPDVTGKKQDEATKALRGLGFVVTVQQAFSDTVPKDVVIAQSPSSGTADKGSTVTLTVSKGPDVVEVPDVRGDSPETASQKLTAAGLVPRRVDIPGGTGSVVVTTDPGHGKKVKRGSTVSIYVV